MEEHRLAKIARLRREDEARSLALIAKAIAIEHPSQEACLAFAQRLSEPARLELMRAIEKVNQ